MSGTQQPEALNLEEFRAKVTRAAREPLLARIAELEAQLSAIGAGGVEPLRKPASVAAHDDEREAFEKWLRVKPCGAAHDFAWEAWKARAALAAPADHFEKRHEMVPENIREGAPYDNPAFEQLARDMGVWGTAQSAVCAQFWLAATQPAAQRSAYAAKGVKEVFCKKCEMTVISNCGSASGCPVRNIYAAQAKQGGEA